MQLVGEGGAYFWLVQGFEMYLYDLLACEKMGYHPNMRVTVSRPQSCPMILIVPENCFQYICNICIYLYILAVIMDILTFYIHDGFSMVYDVCK